MHARAAPTIALAMGEKGIITRLLAAKYGGYLTFATMSPDKSSAPGQPTIHTLRTLYNFGVRPVALPVAPASCQWSPRPASGPRVLPVAPTPCPAAAVLLL